MTEFAFRKVIGSSLMQDLPDAFHEATGVTAGVHDTKGELITKIPKRDFSSFCQNMFYLPEGHIRCVKSNCAGARRSVAKGAPYVHKCHAGLVDVFAPIMYDGSHVGTVCCGQLMFEKPTKKKKAEVRDRLKGLPSDFIERQIMALEGVTVVSKSRVEGLARLLGGISNEFVRLIVANEREKETSEEKTRLIEEMAVRYRLEQEVQQVQIRLKESELRLLEAQINPHFLYNTLDSIQWLAMRHGSKDIQDMVCSLSSLMRYSLGRGNNIISLAEELDQIRSYLSIQKVRYQEKLQYSINVEPELFDYRIPKLVLQPLVENAIKHGIDPSTQAGTVTISGWRLEDESAVLEVENDGVPITVDKIRSMGRALEESKNGESVVAERGRGYGLSNVHERLKLNFGPEYGLSFAATKNGGLSVRLVVPPFVGRALELERIRDADQSTHR